MNPKTNPFSDLAIMQPEEGIVLFYPHVPAKAKQYMNSVLETRWIGQGPKVEQFECQLQETLGLDAACIATGSGTDALHLAYLLAKIQKDDEVLCPLFTCTATNLPLLYIGAKPIFVDVDPVTLNVCPDDLEAKITDRTRAIVIMHYGGLPCDLDRIIALANKYEIPVIQDSAHALGAKYKGQPVSDLTAFSMHSFQAIKHVTTGDGGALVIQDASTEKKAKRLRWFGIDREEKQKGIWENDISEVGYKYQMTDIAAAMGLAALEELPAILKIRRALYSIYVEKLRGVDGIEVVDDFSPVKDHAAWLFTVLARDRLGLQTKLRENGIECGQTHFRNDRYSIFSDNGTYPNMDSVDDEYCILPLHTKMCEEDVVRITETIRSGW